MVSCSKTAEPIEMLFWIKTRVGPRNHVLDGVQIPQGEGAIFGGCPANWKHWNVLCSVAAALTAKGIIQSPITSCSRINLSVCHASANNILKISGCRQCSLSPAKGALRLHSSGEVWYLRLPCWCCYWQQLCTHFCRWLIQGGPEKWTLSFFTFMMLNWH